MHKYIQYSLFSALLILNPICGTTCNKIRESEPMKSINKTKLGLKTLGAASSYFITYKMIKCIEKSLASGPKVIPGKGLVIDIAFIPAGIIGLASFALGTTFLTSALDQTFKNQEKQNQIEKCRAFQKDFLKLQVEDANQQQLLMRHFKTLNENII